MRRCQIFSTKMHQIKFRLRLYPRPRRGELTVLPTHSCWGGAACPLHKTLPHTCLSNCLQAWIVPLLETFTRPCLPAMYHHGCVVQNAPAQDFRKIQSSRYSNPDWRQIMSSHGWVKWATALSIYGTVYLIHGWCYFPSETDGNKWPENAIFRLSQTENNIYADS